MSIDSLLEVGAVVVAPNKLQIKNADSSINVHTNAQFDFTQPFEYEIIFTIDSTTKGMKKFSFCLGLDSLTHDHGLSVYMSERKSFYLATPNPLTKTNKGTSLSIPQKQQTNKVKVNIRYFKNRYDIFVNDRYLGKLKDAPIFRNGTLHFGNYEPNTTITFNQVSLIKL